MKRKIGRNLFLDNNRANGLCSWALCNEKFSYASLLISSYTFCCWVLCRMYNTWVILCYLSQISMPREGNSGKFQTIGVVCEDLFPSVDLLSKTQAAHLHSYSIQLVCGSNAQRPLTWWAELNERIACLTDTPCRLNGVCGHKTGLKVKASVKAAGGSFPLPKYILHLYNQPRGSWFANLISRALINHFALASIISVK